MPVFRFFLGLGKKKNGQKARYKNNVGLITGLRTQSSVQDHRDPPKTDFGFGWFRIGPSFGGSIQTFTTKCKVAIDDINQTTATASNENKYRPLTHLCDQTLLRLDSETVYCTIVVAHTILCVHLCANGLLK